jgi:hypothetical protein
MSVVIVLYLMSANDSQQVFACQQLGLHMFGVGMALWYGAFLVSCVDVLLWFHRAYVAAAACFTARGI